MDAVGTLIDWMGPYSDLESAGEDVGKIFDPKQKGMYMLIGRRNCFHWWQSLLYVGIGNVSQRLRPTHHIIKRMNHLKEIWIGERSCLQIDREAWTRNRSPHIEDSEWTMAFFMEMPLNRMKRRNPPPNSQVLVNAWHDRSTGDRIPRPHKHWPDILWWDEDTRLCYKIFIGKPEKIIPLPASQVRRVRG